MRTWKLVFGAGLGEIHGQDDGLAASFPIGPSVTVPTQGRLRPWGDSRVLCSLPVDCSKDLGQGLLCTLSPSYLISSAL